MRISLPDARDAIFTGAVRAWGRAWNLHGPRELGTPMSGPPAPGHRDPVVLLNGIACDNEMWTTFARSLRRDGFDVYVAPLPDKALGDIDGTATWLADYVAGIRAQTHAAKVDLVGYSEGGLVGRSLVRDHGGAGVVDSLVTLGTPHNGVTAHQVGAVFDHLGAAVPEALRQMVVGSDWLRHLNAGDPTPGRVRYTSIMSAGWDGIVWPGTAPVLEGANNVVLPRAGWHPLFGPNHGELIQRSDAAYDAVRAALLAM